MRPFHLGKMQKMCDFNVDFLKILWGIALGHPHLREAIRRPLLDPMHLLSAPALRTSRASSGGRRGEWASAPAALSRGCISRKIKNRPVYGHLSKQVSK